jgi:hypothetical protein
LSASLLGTLTGPKYPKPRRQMSSVLLVVASLCVGHQRFPFRGSHSVDNAAAAETRCRRRAPWLMRRADQATAKN